MAIFPHDIGKRGFKEQNGIFMKQSKNKYKFPQSILSMNLDYNLKLNSWNNKEPQINLYLVINAPQKCKKIFKFNYRPSSKNCHSRAKWHVSGHSWISNMII